MENRVQKIIAAHGIVSRRAAEKLIKDGRVKVNGAVIELGAQADVEKDEIMIDDKPIKPLDSPIYIMLNKPAGYVTTMKDEFSRKNVSDLVAGIGLRIYPIGRLDMDSEGLLLFTNDGSFANRLMHPSFNKVKKYEVDVSGELENISKLSEPMVIDGYRISPAQVEILSKNKKSALVCISIHEGRNRQIRKMCELVGLRVKRLRRVSIGNVELGDLEEGKWRYLTAREIQSLAE